MGPDIDSGIGKARKCWSKYRPARPELFLVNILEHPALNDRVVVCVDWVLDPLWLPDEALET